MKRDKTLEASMADETFTMNDMRPEFYTRFLVGAGSIKGIINVRSGEPSQNGR